MISETTVVVPTTTPKELVPERTTSKETVATTLVTETRTEVITKSTYDSFLILYEESRGIPAS